MDTRLAHFLDSQWTAPGQPPRRPAAQQIALAVLWPIAVFLFLHRTLIAHGNGSVTDDFTTVYSAIRRFLDGVPVYNETYYFVDPHYLYSPGATLFLSPLGLFGNGELVRWVFVFANAFAIMAAIALLCAIARQPLSSWVFPGSIAAAFLTESVTNTLVFSNINGLLLLTLSTFYWASLRNRKILAGLILGVAILIKPLFLPLLFIPAVRGAISTLSVALGVVVAFNLAGWALVPSAGDYVTVVLPYLDIVRDYSNSSLPGLGVYFGMPGWLQTSLFLVFAAIIIIGLVALLRVRIQQPEVWMMTTGSLLLTGVFFLSSLGQMYYSMLLFPLVFTAFFRQSAAHYPTLWIGLYLALSGDNWQSNEWVDAGRWFHFFQATVGWGMIILTVCVAAVLWWAQEHPRKDSRDRQPTTA